MSLFQPVQFSSLPPQLLKYKSNSKTGIQRHKLQILPNSTFLWNSLLCSQQNPLQTLLSFHSMLTNGFLPDSYTLPLALKASINCNLFSCSLQIHSLALKLGLLSNTHVFISLMEVYAHFHGHVFAFALLSKSCNKNPILWTSLITVCLKESNFTYALELFDKMLELEVELDSVAFVTVAKACGEMKSIRSARKVYEVAKKNGFLGDVKVGNSIMKMYIECGRIEDARLMYEEMKVKDLVSWSTMINGFVKNGEFNEGLKIFRAMCYDSVRPDSFCLSSVLPACGRMSAYKNGKEIHAKIVRLHIHKNVVVGNALIDMYVKSGSIKYATTIFYKMIHKDIISWTVMILGYSLHGQGEQGLKLFKKMTAKDKILPDNTTYVAALHATNTACMVEEGKRIFQFISIPEVKHYALMANLLACGGNFIEAREFILKHNLTKCALVHRAVLNGCRIHQNIKLGKRIVEELIELEPLNTENYVMLCNIYALDNSSKMVNKFRRLTIDMGLMSRKAYSWIEIKNKAHVFGTGDVSHPRSEGVYWEVKKLFEMMKNEVGYNERDDCYSLHDVDEERECVPYGHSEVLAIGLGLINGSNVSLRVSKNLRVCWNCHEFAKFVSRRLRREIILKDVDRFHHFRNGVCSCKDMW